MSQPTSCEEWKTRALAEDRRTGRDRRWEREESALYEHRVIRRRRDELVGLGFYCARARATARQAERFVR
jgi:hypothetical protein